MGAEFSMVLASIAAAAEVVDLDECRYLVVVHIVEWPSSLAMTGIGTPCIAAVVAKL